MNLEEYQKKAISKRPEHEKFLNWLKRNKPKNLDRIAEEKHDEVFAKIDCLSCGNCCRTTGPLITAQDVKKMAKAVNLSEKDFEATYLKIDEDGDMVFQSMPCPFLGEDNYCFIYENRPKACREFPHTDRRKLYQINHLTIKNTVICPAAYQIVEELKEFYS